MPLVRISLRQGTSIEFRKAIGEGVHAAMVEALAVPSDDRFQVISEYPPEGLIYDPQYLGVNRTDSIVIVQITLSFGRKPQQKRLLFNRRAKILKAKPGLRPEDLLINLVEVNWENWSFGNGQAQYMDTQTAAKTSSLAC
jgi:phenylpyruvate tautomerase PptA (4-oxalocrotonate tautomerase family)